MQTLEYKTIDKTTWGPGPWQDEPDKVQWQDAATGLPCLIVRNMYSGNLCGYVGLAPGHPLYLCSHHDCNPQTHYGLSFSGGCSHGPEEQSICHKPDVGEPDNVWWLGFDCGHAPSDAQPGLVAHYKSTGTAPDMVAFFSRGQYRDLAYVKNEVTKLAQQLVVMT